MNLYEILVPTKMFPANGSGVVDWGGELVSASTAHHRVWDNFVRSISGWLTILSPAKGQWFMNYPTQSIGKMKEGELIEEKVIPVRIACSPDQMTKIADFTAKHYRQAEVMYYAVSNNIVFHKNKEFQTVCV